EHDSCPFPVHRAVRQDVNTRRHGPGQEAKEFFAEDRFMNVVAGEKIGEKPRNLRNKRRKVSIDLPSGSEAAIMIAEEKKRRKS
ncbi:MAG: hypothetical protein EBV06_15895, partial [Planctomycetia bacterium]|nr:hypothetical protein [Planctomycetia bacterium]